MTSSYKRAIYTLEAYCFEGERQTGYEISKKISNCLDEWGLDSERILALTHDNGSNIISAVNIL